MRTSVKSVVSIRDMVLAGSGIVCQEGGDRVILGDVDAAKCSVKCS
jgi:hypothetical protein